MLVTFSGIILDFDTERVYVVELPLKKGRTYGEVMFIGDIHYGHPDCSRNQLLRHLWYCQENKHVRIVLMGDYWEADEYSPFLRAMGTSPVPAQLKMFFEDFKPLRNRIDVVLWGNHDYRLLKAIKSHVDILRLLLYDKELGDFDPNITKIIPPQRGALIVYKVGKMLYPVYAFHGSTTALVNPDVQLKRAHSNIWVPLIVQSHTHNMLWKDRTTMTIGMLPNGKIGKVIMRQYWLLTGCFLRYPGYAEEKSAPITDIGAPIVRFYADRNAVECVKLREKYPRYLDPKVGHAYKQATVEVFPDLTQTEERHDLLQLLVPRRKKIVIGEGRGGRSKNKEKG